jgi:hypothetical protein
MSEINPYESPSYYINFEPDTMAETQPEGPWVFRKGNQLVMHKDALLPDRCVKSNQPAGGLRLCRKLSWHHPLIYFTAIFGLVVYPLLAIAHLKQATIYVGLSKPWFSRRRRAILISWGLALLGIAIFGSYAFISDPHSKDAWFKCGAPLGILVLLGGVIYGIIKSQIVSATRITEDYIWLKGVHPDYLADLPEWPYNP